MIYRLNDEFTKLEEHEGIMQNLNRHLEIEIVVCTNNPAKDSGLLLLPLEKLPFAAQKGQDVYARCARVDGSHANISVVNFKTPAASPAAAGEEVVWSGSIGTNDSAPVTDILALNQSLDAYRKVKISCTLYNSCGNGEIRPQIREFYVSDLRKSVTDSNVNLSVCWGASNTTDYINISAVSGDLTQLKAVASFGFINEITGII